MATIGCVPQDAIGTLTAAAIAITLAFIQWGFIKTDFGGV
jgi:hypothetical protein